MKAQCGSAVVARRDLADPAEIKSGRAPFRRDKRGTPLLRERERLGRLNKAVRGTSNKAQAAPDSEWPRPSECPLAWSLMTANRRHLGSRSSRQRHGQVKRARGSWPPNPGVPIHSRKGSPDLPPSQYPYPLMPSRLKPDTSDTRSLLGQPLTPRSRHAIHNSTAEQPRKG
jgi:hypothetical protein